jgi:KipI family sensor histidine kinase inhibitor
VSATVVPYGDSALLLEVDGATAALGLVAALAEARATGPEPPGLGAVVAGAGNVVVRFDPAAPRPDLVEAWVRVVAGRPHPPDRTGPGRLVEVPVVFDGPDLDAVAAATGLTPERVVELLTGAELRVAFLGFSPGFPYLVGLPAELETIARRPTPRTSVPAGSVALAGGYAAVYPQSTPGGWQLLGHTGVRLFDPDRPPYATLRVGDTVRFTRSSTTRSPPATEADPAGSHPLRPPDDATRTAEILEPGLLSLVEDGGRRAVAALCIPESGAADADSLRLANRLAGNRDGDAAVEITVLGPTLRFSDPVHLAVVGCRPGGVEVGVDGHPVPSDAVLPVHRGQVVHIGRVSAGLRAYLAVSGGFAGPEVVGSRSTDLLSGLGPAPLAARDRLELGAPVRPRGLLAPPAAPDRAAPPGSPTTIGVLAGPHRFPAADLDRLTSVVWTVGGDSNRIGLRLRGEDGPGVRMAPEAPVDSTAMITGAVQVPPDGDPIILMPDHATVGGYPVIACVISADLAALGQLRPGDTLAFLRVDLAEARDRHRSKERHLADRVTGWYPTGAGT